MAKSNSKRITLTIPEDAMERLGKLKHDAYYDRPWAEMCMHVLLKGLRTVEAEIKKGK